MEEDVMSSDVDSAVVSQKEGIPKESRRLKNYIGGKWMASSAAEYLPV